MPETLLLPPPRLLRLSEVMRLTGLSKATIYRREKDGTFPKRRQVSAHRVGWVESEIYAWINARPTCSLWGFPTAWPPCENHVVPSIHIGTWYAKRWFPAEKLN